MMRTSDGFFHAFFLRFLFDERGAAIDEYALVASFFAAATILTLQTISTNATWQLTHVQNGLMSNSVTPP